MQLLMNFQQQLTARAADSPLWLRWQRLAPRERLSLGLLAVFLLIALLYMTLWLPATRELKQARAYYQQQRELNAYLVENSPQARQLAGKPLVNLAPEQLQGLVTQSAQQHGLVVERFDSDAEGLLVSLAEAPFASLLRWMSDLQSQGVGLAEVSLDRAGDGKVDARLTLKAGN